LPLKNYIKSVGILLINFTHSYLLNWDEYLSAHMHMIYLLTLHSGIFVICSNINKLFLTCNHIFFTYLYFFWKQKIIQGYSWGIKKEEILSASISSFTLQLYCGLQFSILFGVVMTSQILEDRFSVLNITTQLILFTFLGRTNSRHAH
jgi:hypothetical protein